MYIYLIVHTAYIQSCVCHTDLKECSTTIQGYLAGPEQSRIEHLMENTCRTQRSPYSLVRSSLWSSVDDWFHEGKQVSKKRVQKASTKMLQKLKVSHVVGKSS